MTAYLYILNVVLELLRQKKAAVTQPWGGQSVDPLASLSGSTQGCSSLVGSFKQELS